MKPEHLLDAMEDLSPDYISEARPRHLKSPQDGADGAGSAPEREHVSAAPRRKEFQMKHTITQRIMTGAVTAAAVAVFAGGGMFIARQSRQVVTSQSAASTQKISNFLGGTGKITPLPQANTVVQTSYPLLEDDDCCYFGYLAWEKAGEEVQMQMNPCVHFDESWFTADDRLFRAEKNQILEVDSIGTERNVLAIDSYWDYSTAASADVSADDVTVCDFRKICDTADGGEIFLAAARAGGADAQSGIQILTFYDLRQEPDGSWSVQSQRPAPQDLISACGRSRLIMQTVPEQKGFYFWGLSHDVYYVSVSGDQPEMWYIPAGEDVQMYGWYVDGDTLYYLNSDNAYVQYTFNRHESCMIDWVDRVSFGQAFGRGEKTVLSDPAPFAAEWFYEMDGALYSINENGFFRTDLRGENPEQLLTFADREEWQDSTGADNLQAQVILCSRFALVLRTVYHGSEPGAELAGTEVDLSTLALRTVRLDSADIAPEEAPDGAGMEVTPESGRNLFGGQGELRLYESDGLLTAADDFCVYFGDSCWDTGSGYLRCNSASFEYADWENTVLLTDGTSIFKAYHDAISILNPDGSETPFLHDLFPMENEIGDAFISANFEGIRANGQYYFIWGTFEEENTAQQRHVTLWVKKDGEVVSHQVQAKLPRVEYRFDGSRIYGLYWDDETTYTDDGSYTGTVMRTDVPLQHFYPDGFYTAYPASVTSGAWTVYHDLLYYVDADGNLVSRTLPDTLEEAQNGGETVNVLIENCGFKQFTVTDWGVLYALDAQKIIAVDLNAKEPVLHTAELKQHVYGGLAAWGTRVLVSVMSEDDGRFEVICADFWDGELTYDVYQQEADSAETDDLGEEVAPE